MIIKSQLKQGYEKTHSALIFLL